MNNMYYEIMGQTLFLLSCLAFLLGIAMIVMPDKILSVSVKYSRWINTDGFFENLNRQTSTESVFYKRHRLLGILIIAGAVYTLYVLVLAMDPAEIGNMLPATWNPIIQQWIAQSIFYLLVLANIVAFCFGVIVFIRPSALKDIEKLVNRWLQTDAGAKSMDRQVTFAGLEQEQSIRYIGVLVLIGSIYIAYMAMKAV